MKLESIIITSALAFSCGSLQALDLAPPRGEMLHPQQNFTELEGIEVRNLQNEKLGRVKFITADLENARLVEVVMSSGGFLGIGGKCTSAPPRAFTMDTSKQVLRLDVSKARFDAAPRFNTSDVSAYSQPARVAEVIRHYGLQPWFYTDGKSHSNNAETLRLGHVERTDRILGMQIKSPTGQYLGQVGGVQMDLIKGQITHVVDETQVMGDNGTYILQARALRYNAENNGLILYENLAQLKGEPHLQWVGENREYFQEESFVNRKVQADQGLHSKQNAQEGIVNRAAAMQQGANFRDVKKTKLIKQGILADASLSSDAKGVEVVTLNAQTTLRGHVNTEASRRRIGVIAANAGRPENVSNQIEVRSVSSAR